jgi:hypothetical protein
VAEVTEGKLKMIEVLASVYYAEDEGVMSE